MNNTIESLNATIVLPDGSTCTTACSPLPADHWLYEPVIDDDPGRPILTLDQRDAVLAAARWAIRASTLNGRASYDPDALAQNIAFALCGPLPLSGRRVMQGGGSDAR